jgi:hypothetical protein
MVASEGTHPQNVRSFLHFGNDKTPAIKRGWLQNPLLHDMNVPSKSSKSSNR